MLRLRLVLLFASGLICLTGCNPKVDEKPSPPSAEDRDKPAVTTYVPNSLDLGGPCSERKGRLALSGKQEDDLRNAKNWAALIEGAKQDVRDSCSNAFRWVRLFTVFVEGQHYLEATQALDEMKLRGFPLPFATLSNARPEFLTSEEFKSSIHGLEFEKRKVEIAGILQRAESTLASMSKESRPPGIYQSKGACPFECCTYREWKTTKAVQLLESIGSSKVVASVGANESVRAMTGEVHVEPEPRVALEDLGALKAGDVIFFLDNLGEGHVNYWYNGTLKPELGLDEGLLFYSFENCMQNNGPGSCSIRKLHPEKTYRNEWWIHIRTKEGKEGWALNTGQFQNMDACG